MKKDQNNSWQARASYGRGLGLYPSIAAWAETIAMR